MTVQVQKAYQYYQGPILANTELPIIEFTFIDNSHVSAKIRNNDKIWQYNIDYKISGAGTTERKITVLKEVLATEILAVYLDVPITQMVAPEEGGLFPAATQEFTLDKLTYICQMLQEKVTRSLQISVDTEFNGILPELLPNRTFKVNALGTGLILSEYDPDQAIVTTEDFKKAAEAAAAAAKESEANAKTSETNAKVNEIATEQIKQDTEQIKQDTEQIKQDTEQIKQATQAIADKALQDIGTAKTDAISEVSNTKDSAIQAINTEEALVISNIQTEGAKSIQLAKDWAIKMDGKVNDEDYSSKYYAEKAAYFGADKLKVDCSNLSETGKKVFDGQWVAKAQGLTNIITGSVEVDLSEYLPEDEYNYEIMMTYFAYNPNPNVLVFTSITSSVITTAGVYSYASQSARISGQYIIAVGVDRKINVLVSGGSYPVNHHGIYAIAYRRLGTNE